MEQLYALKQKYNRFDKLNDHILSYLINKKYLNSQMRLPCRLMWFNEQYMTPIL